MIAFDPVFSPEDKDLLTSLGIQIFPENRVSVAFNLFRVLLSSIFLFGFTFRPARSCRIFDFDIFFPRDLFTDGSTRLTPWPPRWFDSVHLPFLCLGRKTRIGGFNAGVHAALRPRPQREFLECKLDAGSTLKARPHRERSARIRR